MTEAEQKRTFEEWLDKHRNLIFKVVRAYALTSMDQDDLFQDIALQIWFSVPSFRNESSVSTWIYRISLNTAIKWSVKERRQSTESFENPLIVLHDNIPAADERLAWLYEEIQRLDEIDRSLALLLLDDYSYREMAGILGISESNVGVKINRIKKHLISKLKHEHHGI